MPKKNKNKEFPLVTMAPGIQRKILGYQENLMLVKVFFEKGSVAAVHHHPHQQIGFILDGRFELEVGRKKDILSAGDCFSVPANVRHGATCLEKGIILDSFSPMRKDFLG